MTGRSEKHTNAAQPAEGGSGTSPSAPKAITTRLAQRIPRPRFPRPLGMAVARDLSGGQEQRDRRDRRRRDAAGML